MKSIQIVTLFTCSLSLLATCALAEIGNIRLVRDIGQESNAVRLRNLHVYGDQLLFTGDGYAYALDLNTRQLVHLCPDEPGTAQDRWDDEVFYNQDDGLVYFRMHLDDTYREWWRTDGTPEGTWPLPELGEGQTGWVSYDTVRNSGEALDFYGKSNETYGWWRLQDGSYTLLQGDQNFGVDGYISHQYPASNGTYLLFEAQGGNNPLYYLPDDTLQPVQVLADAGYYNLVAWGDRLLIRNMTGGDTILSIVEGTPESLKEIYHWETSNGDPDLWLSLALDETDQLVVGGRDLWIIDGAQKDIRRLLWGWENSHSRYLELKPLFQKDGYLYFCSHKEESLKLWRIPLTGGDKELVKEIDPDPYSDGLYRDALEYRGKWYFLAPVEFPEANSGIGQALWETDGTSEGTRKLAAFPITDHSLHAWENYIIVNSIIGYGSELRMVDLTTGATEEWSIANSEIQNDNGLEHVLGVHDGYAILRASTGVLEPQTLWVSDGSTLGTRPVSPVVQNPTQLISTSLGAFVHAMESGPYGSGVRRLYRIDPATATSELLDLDLFENPSYDFWGSISAFGDSLYLEGKLEDSFTLHRYHPDSLQIQSIPLPNPEVSIQVFTIGNNLLIEQDDTIYRLDLDDDSWQYLAEVWSKSPSVIASQSNDNGKPLMFFLLSTGGLALSDGTEAGTRVLFTAMPDGFEVHRGEMAAGDTRVYFFAGPKDDPYSDPRLWACSTDGGDPWQVMDLSPIANRPIFNHLAVIGDRCFFRADDGTHGYEPWISDGTPEGTRLLKDISPEGGNSLWDQVPCYDCVLPVTGFSVFHDKAYFNAFADTAQSFPYFLDFWCSDGTESGTQLVDPGESGEPVVNIEKVYLFDDLMVLENTLNGLWIVGDDVSFAPSTGWYPVGFAGETFRTRVFDGGDLLYVWENDATYGSELFAIDLCSARGYFSNSTRAANGWSWHPVYGWIWGGQFPWIWLQDAASWLYCMGDGVPEANLYHPDQGWLYSPLELYPWVYCTDLEDWLQLD